MTKKTAGAFTLIELLVVISIIAVLAALAVPALTNALTKGQMTGTMNNARQLYLAGFQMATDGAANSDPNYAWPGEGSPTPPATLADYCTKLGSERLSEAGRSSEDPERSRIELHCHQRPAIPRLSLLRARAL